MNTGNRAQRGAGRGHAFHAEPDNTTTEDTGAAISVIFSNFLTGNEQIDQSRKLTINGIAGSTKSYGTVNITLEAQNNFIDHEFHIIDDIGYNMNDNIQVSLDRVNKVLDLIDMKTLNKEEKDSIQKICAKYSDVFLLENDHVTVTNVITESITLKDNARPAVTNVITESITLKDNARPVYVKPYRLPHAHKIQIDEQIDKMLADGIIEETRSNWSSPLLIVPKKPDCHGNKQWRIVVDYRLLNKNIEDDRLPLPNITEILDSLSGAFYFTHLDLSQGGSLSSRTRSS
ncbi:hypothetical protein QE152_g4348 [Popillia japonica]|uniref:Polyprotein n=1 Tax=Popillia japonica TaxID=7064 RepID=A0AAW1N140_POPJA